MARHAVLSSPETSQLVTEAPVELLALFFTAGRFGRVLDEDLLPADPTNTDEVPLRDRLRQRLNALPADRRKMVEDEARRVTSVAEPKADELLRRLAAGAETGPALFNQRDAIARSLWACLHAQTLFVNTERALRLQHYRDYRKLYDAYEIEAPVPLAPEAIDRRKLANEVAARLRLEQGCEVEAFALPGSEGGRRAVLVVLTSAGPFSSVKTVEKDLQLRTIYIQSPNEVSLVYTPATRTIEVCAHDPAVRRIIAATFAETALDEGASHKPLGWKTYDLRRFRKTLRLEIPPEERDVVLKARVIEVQVTLGSWKQRLSLKVTADDDIEEFARKALGSLPKLANAGLIVRVEFHIRFRSETGKERTLSFSIVGRNRCSLQSEKDPEKRDLGFRLLEDWKILQRHADLSKAEEQDLLPILFRLYDQPDPEISGSMLLEQPDAAERLERAVYLLRTDQEEVVLLEDEIFGTHDAMVGAGAALGSAGLNPADDAEGPAVSSEEVARFRLNLPYVCERIEAALSPVPRRGRSSKLTDHLVRLGELEVDGSMVPAWLARGLADDRIHDAVERIIRGETADTKGIVFVAGEPRLPWIGTHVVLSIAHLLGDHEGVDSADLASRYRAALAGAAAGDTVTFEKTGSASALLHIPGDDPWPVIGEQRVAAVEKLYRARNKPPLKTSELMAHCSGGHPSNIFRDGWEEIKGRYLCSPRTGYWELCRRK